MIKQTIEISREPAHLAVRHRQLVIKKNGDVAGQVPCEDIGVLLVDNPQATYTHALLATLAECDAAVVICGRDHLPSAVLLPLAGHSQVVVRQADQIAASRPLCKQLWKQIVRAKIVAQAANLDADSPARRKLLDLATQVRSGDPTNVEAYAAKVYWAAWRPDENFKRDYDGDGLNALLNYGYAVLRAAVARAIVAAGLSPSVGVHHHNRANAFCLADDLVEPLRPLVDDRARELFRQGYDELTQEAKARLLELLAEPVELAGETGPLMVSLHRYVASLTKCYAGEIKNLEIPQAIP